MSSRILMIIERVSDIPDMDAWLQRFSRTETASQVLVVIGKGRLKARYPFVVELPWHRRRRFRRALARIQDQFAAQVLIHVCRNDDSVRLCSDGLRYIRLIPLRTAHSMDGLLYWDRSIDAFSSEASAWNPGVGALPSGLGSFSQKGIADQFMPLKATRPAWGYGASGYPVVYLKRGRSWEEVQKLVRTVQAEHKRCVLVANTFHQKVSMAVRYYFDGDVFVVDAGKPYPLLSLLKKCSEVIVPSRREAWDAMLMEKRVRLWDLSGMQSPLSPETNAGSLASAYFVVPSNFLFQEGFLSHLVQADLTCGPILDGTWGARINPVCRDDIFSTKGGAFHRKLRKFVDDPERFFRDSKKGWLRRLGRIVFRTM